MDVIIREEIFGATIFYNEIGEKFYVNKEEFNRIISDKVLPEDCIIDPNINIRRIIKVNGKENKDKFSFADIAYIELTRACNLRCKHCLNNSGIVCSNEISYSELIRLINLMIDAGIFEIRFTGGEPLLYSNIYEIIKYCNDNGLYTSIGTNGTLITETVIKKLKKAGLNKAIVSLDGTKESHDSIRGNGNYLKTLNAIKLLKKYGIEYKINSVIMKDNMEDIIILAKNMYNEGNPLFIRRFIESGRGANLKNNTLSFDDYEYVKKQLKLEIDSKQLVRGHYINLTDEAKKSRINIPFNVSTSCKAGQRALIITPEGNIHFCGFLAAQGFPPIGNTANIKNFRTFWEKINYQDLLKNLNNKIGEYNSQPGVQQTNCIAYAQNMLNRNKKLYIFYSKNNLFQNQLKKIINDSFIDVEVIEIEDFCQNCKSLSLSASDSVYFLCCNSEIVGDCISKISGGNIINKKFLINTHDKLTCQKKMHEADIKVPNIYETKKYINSFNYPIFLKENKHQGITLQIYNTRTIDFFFKNYNVDEFYFEDSIKSVDEIKLYYINGKVVLKNGFYSGNEEIQKLCKNIADSLGLEIFSADILEYENSYYVIDVNASAGFYLSDIARKEFLYYIGELCK